MNETRLAVVVGMAVDAVAIARVAAAAAEAVEVVVLAIAVVVRAVVVGCNSEGVSAINRFNSERSTARNGFTLERPMRHRAPNVSARSQEDSEVTGQGNSRKAGASAIQRATQLLRSISEMKDINKLQRRQMHVTCSKGLLRRLPRAQVAGPRGGLPLFVGMDAILTGSVLPPTCVRGTPGKVVGIELHADPGFIVHWTFPPGLQKASVWLAYYSFLSRPRIFGQLLLPQLA